MNQKVRLAGMVVLGGLLWYKSLERSEARKRVAKGISEE